MAKCSDPAICSHILEVLEHKGTIHANGWPELRSKLGFDVDVPLTKLKTAIGSLYFKQRRIHVSRTSRYEEPMHEQDRGYRLSIV